MFVKNLVQLSFFNKSLMLFKAFINNEWDHDIREVLLIKFFYYSNYVSVGRFIVEIKEAIHFFEGWYK